MSGRDQPAATLPPGHAYLVCPHCHAATPHDFGGLVRRKMRGHVRRFSRPAVVRWLVRLACEIAGRDAPEPKPVPPFDPTGMRAVVRCAECRLPTLLRLPAKMYDPDFVSDADVTWHPVDSLPDWKGRAAGRAPDPRAAPPFRPVCD